MKFNNMLTRDRLMEVLSYDHATGIFRWLVRLAFATQIGDVAGSLDDKGYVIIVIDGKHYKASRLAWLYHYGCWPPKFVDRHDLNKSNNRIKNLRDATKSQNAANAIIFSNILGFKGVCRVPKSTRFMARIRENGKSKYLGSFDTPEEAHAAYCAEAARIFGEFSKIETREPLEA